MRRIATIGGGFAGATLARRLVRRLPEGREVLLLGEESYTTYIPMLPTTRCCPRWWVPRSSASASWRRCAR